MTTTGETPALPGVFFLARPFLSLTSVIQVNVHLQCPSEHGEDEFPFQNRLSCYGVSLSDTSASGPPGQSLRFVLPRSRFS